MVADEPGQPGPGGQGPVNVVAGPGVVGHRVPPVHGEQGSARQERADAVGEDLLEIPVAEVVQDLREHDEIETPGWPLPGDLALLDLPEGKPVRRLLGEVPVVAVRADGRAHVLADRCSHMSGPLSGGELTDGCLTCPWHGRVFRIADRSVVRGPATAPQPAFQAREADGAIQVWLPGVG